MLEAKGDKGGKGDKGDKGEKGGKGDKGGYEPQLGTAESQTGVLPARDAIVPIIYWKGRPAVAAAEPPNAPVAETVPPSGPAAYGSFGAAPQLLVVESSSSSSSWEASSSWQGSWVSQGYKPQASWWQDSHGGDQQHDNNSWEKTNWWQDSHGDWHEWYAYRL